MRLKKVSLEPTADNLDADLEIFSGSSGDLRDKSIKGVAVTLVSQSLEFVLGLGSTMILARLLVPADFGLLAMVSAFTGLGITFMDLGLSASTVQRPKITHGQLSSLFWVNAGAGAMLMILIVVFSPVMAWFYGESRVAPVALILAFTFLLMGCTVQHTALLRRQMRFQALAIVKISSLVGAILVGVSMALNGFGYWALVGLAVARETVCLTLTWFASGWRPGPPGRIDEIRPMLSFGGYLTGFSVLSRFAGSADSLLIGRYWGSAPLGLYSKAFGLLRLPVQRISVPISSVAVPILSRLQNDPDRYRRYYKKGVGLLGLLGMPVVTFCAVDADHLIGLFLGSQWLGSVSIFRALAPASFLATSAMVTGWVYNSLGNVKRRFQWGLIEGMITVTAIAIGVPFGTVAVAIAYSVGYTISTIASIPYCFRGTFLKVTDVAGAIWKPAFASIVAGFGLATIRLALDLSAPILIQLGLHGLVYGVLYLAIWLILPGSRLDLKDMRDIASSLWTREPVAQVLPNSLN